MKLVQVRHLLTASAVAALLGATQFAHAIPLVFNGSTGANNFHATLSGGGSITMSANIGLRFSVHGALGFTDSGNVSIPAQTVPLTIPGGQVNINTTPTGGADLTLAGQQSAGPIDPGGDGIPPFPAGDGVGPDGLPSALTYADLRNLDVTLVPNQSVNLNPVQVNGDASINIFSLFDLGFDLTLNGNPSIGIQNLAFTQSDAPGNDIFFMPGVRIPTPPGNLKDWTTRYAFAAGAGNFTGNVNAQLAGVNAQLSLSILGLFDIPFNFSLGNFSLLNQPLNEALAIVGNGELRDLNPGGYDGLPTGDDMRFTYNDGGLLAALAGALSFDLSTSGSIPVTFHTTQSLNLGLGSVSVDIDGNGSVVFTANASIDASNIGYQLQDTIEDVVIPEPSSILLAGLGALGLLVQVARRRRS